MLPRPSFQSARSRTMSQCFLYRQSFVFFSLCLFFPRLGFRFLGTRTLGTSESSLTPPLTLFRIPDGLSLLVSAPVFSPPALPMGLSDTFFYPSPVFAPRYRGGRRPFFVTTSTLDNDSPWPALEFLLFFFSHCCWSFPPPPCSEHHFALIRTADGPRPPALVFFWYF